MDQEHYSTMRKIILISMILVPVATFISILGIGYLSFTRTIEKRTVANLKGIVKAHRHMIESFLSERKSDLDFAANTHSFEELKNQDFLGIVLERLQRKSVAFSDLGIFDASGLHVAYQGPYKLTGKIYRDEEWFKTVLKNGYYISDVFSGFRNAPHFIIGVVRHGNGRTWVVRATIDTFIFNHLVESIRIGKTGEAYILNAAGILQTERRSGGGLLEKSGDSQNYPESREDIQSFILKDVAGIEYLYTTAWMKNNKWRLVVRQEKADAFSTIRTATYISILIIITGGALIVGIAFYLTDRIIHRMELLDSEKKQLNQQLIGASRLAELGEMAAGFAHEINNPLQIIKSEHSLIKMILSESVEAGKYDDPAGLTEINDSMDQIELQIGRCAAITQAILKFGRQSDPCPRDINLNELMPEILKMVEKKAGVQNISIVPDFAEIPLVIHGEPSEIQQILLNLLNNAMYAIQENPLPHEGRITIKTERVSDGFVKIEVQDNGVGISTENLKKIFSPFFTTKPVGKGTGLGLSVCYGIIQNMGGSMEVESDSHMGTKFTIRLPEAA